MIVRDSKHKAPYGMPKPHIARRQGFWWCSGPSANPGFVMPGMGRSIDEAWNEYSDWYKATLEKREIAA